MLKIKEIFFCPESSLAMCKTALKQFKNRFVNAYSDYFPFSKIIAAPMEMCLIFIKIKPATGVSQKLVFLGRFIVSNWP
jgi:hypothetical protein